MSDNEDTSDSRDSVEQQLDRERYTYFTEEEFAFFSKDGRDVMEKAHSSYRKRLKKRIAKFSLPFDKSRQVEKDLNIVLLGKTGSGKSSTANSILGKEAFKVSRSSNSVTKVSLDNTCTYKNRIITVVDTPGVHDTETDEETVKNEIARMPFLLKDGVHCFIICISASDTRFTEELQDMLRQIEQKGRGNFYDYCMLVYTKAETELEKCTLREFLDEKKKHKINCRLLDDIHERVVAVNNASPVPAEVLRNRDALIEMVDFVVSHNRRNSEHVVFRSRLTDMAKKLHVKISSIVKSKGFHPMLVNTMVEAIVHHCSSDPSFDESFEKAIEILKKRNSSELCDKMSDLFITVDETTQVKMIYIDQMKQIYHQIKPEVQTFKEMIMPVVVIAAVVTAVGIITSFFI